MSTFLFLAGLALADDSLPCESITPAPLSADLTKVRGPFQKRKVAKLVLQAKQQENDARLACSGLKAGVIEDGLTFALADKSEGQGRTTSTDFGTGRVLTDSAAVLDSVKPGALGYGTLGYGDTASNLRHARNLGFLAGQSRATGIEGGGDVVSGATTDAAERQRLADEARKAAEEKKRKDAEAAKKKVEEDHAAAALREAGAS